MKNLIEYAGRKYLVDTPEKARAMVGLLAKDLGGVRKDLGNISADIGEIHKQISNGNGNGIVPISAVSMLQGLSTPQFGPTPLPTPTPTLPQSPHRTAVPTITAQGVDVTSTIAAGSVDRVIRLISDFTGPYQGGTPVCVITFGSPYPVAPAVTIQQKGAAGLVNLRPLSVTGTTLTMTADNANGVLVEIDIVVTPAGNESFD